MNVTELKLQYNVCEESGEGIPVIIVAAGKSSRMKGINKQFVSLLGIPVIARTLMAFENSSVISKIIVVTAEENIADMQLVCDKYMISKLSDIVAGGNCRHESVMNGMARLNVADKKVLIHDGARPFVTDACITRVINAARESSAVTCAVKLKDTVKVVRADGMVTATPDRNSLAAVQTPQGFKFSLYKSAVAANAGQLHSFTDDCSVVEAFGYPVYIVEGDYRNIKITTAEDLKIAQILAEDEV